MSVEDLNQYTHNFILKAFQIVVESRLGGERIQTNCNPNGHDWFNLSLNEIKDVCEQTKRCLLNSCLAAKTDNEQTVAGDVSTGAGATTATNSQKCTKEMRSSKHERITLKNDWKFCCEISLKTSENESMILEYWMIENLIAATGATTNEIDLDNLKLTENKINIPTKYDVYNRMSLILKSLLTLTRITPAYKISLKQSANSYIICYRIYQVNCSTFDELFRFNHTQEEERTQFTNEIQIGKIRSEFSQLIISFAYRLNTSSSFASNAFATGAAIIPANDLAAVGASPTKSPNITMGMREKLSPVDEINRSPKSMPLKNDHFRVDGLTISPKLDSKRDNEKLLHPAFAPKVSRQPSFPLLPEIPVTKFFAEATTTSSATMAPRTSADGENDSSLENNHHNDTFNVNHKKQSKPIKIPELNVNESKLTQQNLHIGNSSMPSSPDSYVFVAPFVPDEPNDWGSFFNGPKPNFPHSGDLSDELNEVANQLEMIESNTEQFDKFVESVCSIDSPEVI